MSKGQTENPHARAWDHGHRQGTSEALRWVLERCDLPASTRLQIVEEAKRRGLDLQLRVP